MSRPDPAPRIVCVAGETSGDRLLAPVVASLVAAGYRVEGLGGPLSVAAGLRAVTPFDGLAATGLLEALGSLGPAIGALRTLSRLLPGAAGVVLVDFPEVNTRLLRRASRLGIPSFYIGPPQAWAWRPGRARLMARASWVGCLFPFAAEWYQARGVSAVWVGHPLVQTVQPTAGGPCLGLMPGSRDAAVRALLPVQLAAAAALHRQRGTHAALALAPGVDHRFITGAIRAADCPVAVFEDVDHMLGRCRVVVAGMGTATLHAVLAGRRVVGCARVAATTAAVAGALVKVEHLALPNLVLGRRAFPELVQSGCTAPRLVQAILRQWAEPEGAVAAVRAALDGVGGYRAGALILAELTRLAHGSRPSDRKVFRA